jgi:hypothetical protein
MISKKGDNVLLLFAALAVLLSIISGFLTFFSVNNFTNNVVGLVTTGSINLSVETGASFNFTTSTLDWGSGRVDAGKNSASLTSYNSPAGKNVSGGNWTLLTAGGLRIQNTGNVNVTLNISAGKTAAQFIGGTGPVYRWNLTAVEAGACLNTTGGSTSDGGPKMNLSEYNDATTSNWIFCEVFQYVSGSNEVRIDINLTVPSDSITGELSDTITASAQQS